MGPKSLINKLVAKADERILTKLFPSKIALIVSSFFFNNFWVFIALGSPSNIFFCNKVSEILVRAVSEEEKKADKTTKKI